jgi:uncharacterized protein YgiM (DUF1202 family)
MVRRLRPLIAFVAVIAAAGGVTAAGLTFTAQTLSKTVAELPPVKQRVLPSYVSRLPVAKASDLDIARSVPVVPRNPIVQQAAIVRPAEEPATTAVDPVPTTGAIVASVTTLSPETVERPAVEGTPYVVRSDVFVRSGPSKSYAQLGTVRTGTPVSVTDESGGWMQIAYSGGTGWVYQRYVSPARAEVVAVADEGSAPF